MLPKEIAVIQFLWQIISELFYTSEVVLQSSPLNPEVIILNRPVEHKNVIRIYKQYFIYEKNLVYLLYITLIN